MAQAVTVAQGWAPRGNQALVQVKAASREVAARWGLVRDQPWVAEVPHRLGIAERAVALGEAEERGCLPVTRRGQRLPIAVTTVLLPLPERPRFPLHKRVSVLRGSRAFEILGPRPVGWLPRVGRAKLELVVEVGVLGEHVRQVAVVGHGQVLAAGRRAVQALRLVALGVQRGAQAGGDGGRGDRHVAVQEGLRAKGMQVLVARQAGAVPAVGAVVARALGAMTPAGMTEKF